MAQNTLRSCEACGFLSTLSSEFTRIDGVTFDRACADQYRRGLAPVCEWVADAIANAKNAETAPAAPLQRRG